MTVRPPNRRAVQALKRHHDFVERLVADGIPRENAIEQAYEAMRDNGKGDWRRG